MLFSFLNPLSVIRHHLIYTHFPVLLLLLLLLVQEDNTTSE